jgi:hypothetical protein
MPNGGLKEILVAQESKKRQGPARQNRNLFNRLVRAKKKHSGPDGPRVEEETSNGCRDVTMNVTNELIVLV